MSITVPQSEYEQPQQANLGSLGHAEGDKTPKPADATNIQSHQISRISASGGALDFFLVAASAVLLLIVGWSAVMHYRSEYLQPQSYYSYTPLIPLLTLFMLWYRRAALRVVVKKPCYGALLALVPALALLVFATKMQMPAVQCAAFVLSFWSSLWLVNGSGWMRIAAFPLAYLALAAPLPGPVLNDISYSLQQFCIHSTARLLGLLTFQPTLDGNVLSLDNYTVAIDMARSGFNLIFFLMALGMAMAYLFNGGRYRRLALLLLALPISIAVNVIRLTLMCVIGECLGTEGANIFHQWDGALTLIAGVAVFIGLARMLGCRRFAGLLSF